jgi:hypothetical protein
MVFLFVAAADGVFRRGCAGGIGRGAQGSSVTILTGCNASLIPAIGAVPGLTRRQRPSHTDSTKDGKTLAELRKQP